MREREREKERERKSQHSRERVTKYTIYSAAFFFLVVLRLTTYLDDNWGPPGNPGRFIS